MLLSIAGRLSPGGEKDDHSQLQADFSPANKPLKEKEILKLYFLKPLHFIPTSAPSPTHSVAKEMIWP